MNIGQKASDNLQPPQESKPFEGPNLLSDICTALQVYNSRTYTPLIWKCIHSYPFLATPTKTDSLLIVNVQDDEDHARFAILNLPNKMGVYIIHTYPKRERDSKAPIGVNI